MIVKTKIGETVNLSLDSREGKNFITFTVETSKAQLNCNDQDKVKDVKRTVINTSKMIISQILPVDEQSVVEEKHLTSRDYKRVVFPAQHLGAITA